MTLTLLAVGEGMIESDMKRILKGFPEKKEFTENNLLFYPKPYSL
jgi:hypothetical protein